MLNQNLLLAGDDAYNLTRSLRFRSSVSAYLNRTPASATNRRTWTWSGWVKRGVITGDYPPLFNAGQSAPDTVLRFFNDDTISATLENGGGGNSRLLTTAVYRDPSAWYHIVWAVDTTQATADNRQRLYVNGVEITSFGTRVNPSQNLDTSVNNTVEHRIGGQRYPSYYDGYLTEVNFIDGQALTPSSFGETDAATGVWKPKKFSGTYGTNGFYLKFTDNSSLSALGTDSSGNGNTWTVNNFSVTSTSSAYDSMKDVPTLTDADTANYCVLNPLAVANSQPTFSNGNLQISAPSAWSGFIGTLGVSNGKWYWEAVNGNSDSYVGICGSNLPFGQLNPQAESGNIVYYGGTGEKRVDGAMTSYGASYSTETIGVALDIDGGTVTFYRNNTSQGSISLSSSTLNGKTIFPFFVKYASTATVNFGQRPFAYTPPTGFKALNTYNLPTPTIGATASSQANKYFDATLYTGTSATQSITNAAGFKPDFVWLKSRSNAQDNYLLDSVRGATKDLYSNLTNAETTNANSLTSFNSNGYTLGSGGANFSPYTYVGWQWQAGQGTTSSNTAGSITSTVSANTTAGFSIVTFNAGTAGNKTVGHGLGVKPAMVIFKDRTTTSSWLVWHQSLSSQTQSYLILQTTAASVNDSRIWANTAPTSTVLSFESGYSFDINDNIVAYCFAQVAGYSAFGSYTGNGSTDGPFIYTGFRPRYVLIKASSIAGENWYVVDATRSPYNAAILYLSPNNSGAEASPGTAQFFDFLSNGFKLRVGGSYANSSGETYIYMAFAESPFKYSLGR